MILESGGGELVGDVIDVMSRKIDQAPVVLRLSEVHRILGGNLSTGEIVRILKKLGFALIPEGQGDGGIPRTDSKLAAGCGARD